VLEAAQTAELVVQAIARSDGTRASVLEQLKAARVKKRPARQLQLRSQRRRHPGQVPILRITGASPPQAGLPSNVQGAVVDRVVEIPQRLIR
jgi:hypothetical protein